MRPPGPTGLVDRPATRRSQPEPRAGPARARAGAQAGGTVTTGRRGAHSRRLRRGPLFARQPPVAAPGRTAAGPAIPRLIQDDRLASAACQAGAPARLPVISQLLPSSESRLPPLYSTRLPVCGRGDRVGGPGVTGAATPTVVNVPELSDPA